jgi:hypothetical protein
MVHYVERVLEDLVSLLVSEPSLASWGLEELLLRLLDRFDPFALFGLLALLLLACSLSRLLFLRLPTEAASVITSCVG